MAKTHLHSTKPTTCWQHSHGSSAKQPTATYRDLNYSVGTGQAVHTHHLAGLLYGLPIFYKLSLLFYTRREPVAIVCQCHKVNASELNVAAEKDKWTTKYNSCKQILVKKMTNDICI